MVFYIKPPKGNISLKKLRSHAVTRLKFLLKISNIDLSNPDFSVKYKLFTSDPAFVESCLCLQEGTLHDRVSHFVLRLLSSSYGDFYDTVILAESLLFQCRLNISSPKRIKQHLAELLRHIDAINSSNENAIDSLSVTCEIAKQLMSNNLVDHVFSIDGKQCKSHTFKVPFQFVLPLVPSRLVVLEDGSAIIPCYDVGTLLRLLFEQILNSTRDSLVVLEDHRFSSIERELYSIYKSNLPNLTCHSTNFITTLNVPLTQTIAKHIQPISANHVDEILAQFPPCMKHLHDILRCRHRLTHTARIHYTLFLKEIGMPYNEATIFWKSEYSKAPCSTHQGCTHNWNKDQRRYEYSLQHMYGLTGGKRNYSGPRCSTIQGSCSAAYEGGCPFAFLTDEQLVNFVKENVNNEEAIQEIVEARNRQQFTKACSIYLQANLQLPNENPISKPSHYFFTFAKQGGNQGHFI